MNSVEIKIIGNSLAIKRNMEILRKVANSNKNVLILGETGTGKDLTARKLHKLSDRRDKPFIAINCANIPEELFEAELFGYKRGAFTGAVGEKSGLIEMARDGIVFLDEIGDLPMHLQAKILRIVENRELRRIGENATRKIFSRFICATNKNLKEEVDKGRFRKDLYYRINVVSLFIPPLKQRKDDIPLLVDHILERICETELSKKTISQSAIKKLMTHDFAGNIRELENILQRAVLLSDGNTINKSDIRIESEIGTSKRRIDISSEQLRSTLEKCRWNKTRAALEIGKSRRQLYRLLEKYHMRDCIKRN